MSIQLVGEVIIGLKESTDSTTVSETGYTEAKKQVNHYTSIIRRTLLRYLFSCE
ncbi:hypothetical protein ACO2FA_13425 [Staphylococcus warneri]